MLLTLTSLAEEIGVTAVTARQAAMANDLVVVALPLRAVVNLSSDLFGATPAASVVVDAGNYFPITRDGVIPEIEAGMLDSEWVAMRIGRPVIKAFNMIHAHSLASGGSEPGTQGRMAIAIAGDDLLAKARVAAAHRPDGVRHGGYWIPVGIVATAARHARLLP